MNKRYWGYCISDCGWEIEGNNRDRVYEDCHRHAIEGDGFILREGSHMVRLFKDGESGTHNYFLSYDKDGISYENGKTYKQCIEERGAENV